MYKLGVFAPPPRKAANAGAPSKWNNEHFSNRNPSNIYKDQFEFTSNLPLEFQQFNIEINMVLMNFIFSS
jgi:hypothetical protein